MTATLWMDTPQTREGLESHSALIFHCCMSTVLSVAMDMGLLMNERAVFYKQREACFYRTWVYWVANNIFRFLLWGMCRMCFRPFSIVFFLPREIIVICVQCFL